MLVQPEPPSAMPITGELDQVDSLPPSRPINHVQTRETNVLSRRAGPILAESHDNSSTFSCWLAACAQYALRGNQITPHVSSKDLIKSTSIPFAASERSGAAAPAGTSRRLLRRPPPLHTMAATRALAALALFVLVLDQAGHGEEAEAEQSVVVVVVVSFAEKEEVFVLWPRPRQLIDQPRWPRPARPPRGGRLHTLAAAAFAPFRRPHFTGGRAASQRAWLHPRGARCPRTRSTTSGDPHTRCRHWHSHGSTFLLLPRTQT